MILKNRPLVPWKSRNKGSGTKDRVYTRAVMQELLGELPGKVLYLTPQDESGHVKKSKTFQDAIGLVINAHVDEQFGIRGDVELSEFHPEAKRIADHVEKNIPLGGCSIDAICEGAMVDGREVMTKLRKFHRIDFVAEPAGFRICESEADPLSDEEKQLIEASYVPKADFDTLKTSHDQLLTRVAAMESKQSTAPPPRVTEPPGPPAYVPPGRQADPATIDAQIRNCR